MLTACTLWRPWPDPVVAGVKPIENRPNPPPRKLLGELVAIHAGKTWDADGAAFIRARGFKLVEEGRDERIGAIVGVARIAGWLDRRPAKLIEQPDGTESGLVTSERTAFHERLNNLDRDPWWMGPVGILLVDARPIAPVKCRGMQGWFTVPDDVEAVVRERWEAAREA